MSNALPPLPRLPTRAGGVPKTKATSAPTTPFPSVLYCPAEPVDPYSTSAVYQAVDPVQATSARNNGTHHNPLIPKKRRRTTPEELAVLEAAFAVNPLPSQMERSQLASRVGMTGRALQVWFQNRR